MDVTFIENQPFFTKNFPQGERVSEDGNIWDVINPISVPPPEPKQPQTPKLEQPQPQTPELEQPQTLPPELEQLQTPSVEPTMTINKGSMTSGDSQLQSLEPIVYSRQKNTQKADHLTSLLQNHESKLISVTQTFNPHVTFGGDNLNVPIALRKGT